MSLELITQWYQNIQFRAAPASEAASFNAALSSGVLTQAQVIDAIQNAPFTVNYTNVVIREYQAAFGRVPDRAGLEYWVDAIAANPAMLDTLNETFANSAEFNTRYGANAGTGANVGLVTALYTNAYGRSPDAAGLDYWVNSGLSGAQLLKEFANAAEFKSQVAADITAYHNDWADGTGVESGSLKDVDVAVVAGQTFTLTTSIDAKTGGAGNDTFTAAPGASNANTFTALDNLDGGAGEDTFDVSEIGAALASAYTLNTAATVKNIETLNYVVSSDNVGDAVTADVSAWSGLKTANVVISGTDAPLTLLTTKSNVTSASVDGATTSAFTDSGAAGADKLATVTVSNSTGLATITSDALTTVNLTASSGGATVAAAAATRGLTVNLNGNTGGTVTDAEATSLVVNSSGAKTTAATLAAAKAKTVAIDSAVDTTITDMTVAAATGITVTGAGKTTISATTTVTALKTIDATGSSGGVTITPALATGVTFSGGDGKDSIKIGATTKAQALGGGDDTVIIDAVAAFGTGGSVDGGAGSNTLNFNTYANAVTASGTTTFEGTISGFNKLELSGANAAAAAAINLANLDDISDVILSATNTETTTISGMASGGTITFKADQTATKAATVAVTNAALGSSDSLNVGLSKATALSNVELTAADVETINITASETATTLLGNVTHAVTLSATSATSITVAGNAGVTFGTLTGATKVASLDASGVTAGLVSLTTDALTVASTIKGGAGANTIVATAATKDVTYIGQDKVDTITIANAKNNSVTTAGGDDVVTTGSGADTISTGDGNDSVTSGAGLDNVDVGAGTDTYVVTANANGNTYASISGMGDGDKINFLDGAAAGTFNGTKVALASTAAFADYLNAAAASTAAATGTDGLIRWFQYGGDTYLVQDLSTNATFTNGTDQVVKLVGLLDLTDSTIDGATTNVLTLG